MAVTAAFLFGLLVGLAIRPLVDAYVSWKAAERFENAPEVAPTVHDEHVA